MTTTATRLLWQGAGSPTRTGDPPGKAMEPASGPCWWCGLPIGSMGRPRKSLPGTFPPFPRPAVESATHLCEGCSWTLSDKVALSHGIDAAKVRARAAKGGRAVITIRGGEPTRHLVLELDSGKVGLWECGPNATAENPWMSATKELRTDPVDVGPCAFIGAVEWDVIGVPPASKFRNYHHFGTASDWWPRTNADRQWIRQWILSPPSEPWVGTIGDGQKHTLIYAEVSPGTPRLPAVAEPGETVSMFGGRSIEARQVVLFEGDLVYYTPSELGAQLEAVEELIKAGGGDDEIATGRYRHRATLEWRTAYRTYDPVLEPVRGGPTMGLLLFLRRNRKELANAD